MFRKTAFVATLLFASLAVGQSEPTFRRTAAIKAAPGLSVLIIGPESVPAGTLVKLEAKVESGSAEGVTFNWTLIGGVPLGQTGAPVGNYDVTADGKVVYFSSPVANQYTFRLVVGKNGEAGKPPVLAGVDHVVVNQGAPPKPDDPTPSPGPAPKPLPAGRFGLAEFTRAAVQRTTGIDRSLCGQLSANFASIATQMAAGIFPDVAAANEKLQEKNQDTYKAARPAWTPVTNAIRDQLSALKKAGKLSTDSLADVQAAYQEISTGFAAAGN